MLHTDEWLKDAKRLPIGRSARVYHGSECRPNLVVKNLPDRYTAYCHRCHEGGVVIKDYVRADSTYSTVQDNSITPPHDSIPLFLRGVPNPKIPWQKLVAFLHSKSMSVDYLKGYNPKYSASAERLLLDMPDQTVGRSLRSASTAKWLTYRSAVSYVRASALAVEGRRLFVTEDCFSAIKAAHSLPQTFVPTALMGTVAHNDFLRLALSSAGVVLCLDNDNAGLSAAPKIQRALRLLDVPCKTVYPNAGCDPKDMELDWFRNVVESD